MISSFSRGERQDLIHSWCVRAFGADHAASVPQRAVRMLEEAIEAFQAAGCAEELAHRLVAYVFSRPMGELPQEIGGLGITVLALASAAGCSADAEEIREAHRVLSKPIEHFTERNRAKNEAGFDVTGAYPVTKVTT